MAMNFCSIIRLLCQNLLNVRLYTVIYQSIIFAFLIHNIQASQPCTYGLRDAINAALGDLSSMHYLPMRLLETHQNLPYVPVFSCPANSDTMENSAWPNLMQLSKNDILLDIIKNSKVVVCGLGPEDSNNTVKYGFNWGNAGNYSLEKPTGFFPDYLDKIIALISHHYNTNISIERKYFSSGKECFDSVLRNESQMTDIYFLQNVQDDGKSLLHNFYRTCPICGSEVIFVSLRQHGFKNLFDVSTTIRNNPTKSNKNVVAYLTSGNYISMHFLLPMAAGGVIHTREEALEKIRSEEILGLFCTGNISDFPTDDFNIIRTGIIVTMGPWIQRADTVECLISRYNDNLKQTISKMDASLTESSAKPNLSYAVVLFSILGTYLYI